MSKLSHKTSSLILKRFKLLWMLFTLLLLVISLYLNWYFNLNKINQDLKQIATNRSNDLDGIIEDLFQDIYTLPLYGSKITACNSSFSDYLNHIVINNHNIDGIIVSDTDHHLICSTLPKNEVIIPSINAARAISGPFKISLFDQPVYLLQQKISQYQIGIIVAGIVLEDALETPNDASNAVALHDRIARKNVILIERAPGRRWIISTSPESKAITSYNTNSFNAVGKLQSINGIRVIVFGDKKVILSRLWYNQLLSTCLLLILSYLLYLLCNKLLHQRYSLHNAMILALRNQEFYPEYQAVFDKISNRYSGVEVLLRWQDDQDKIIMPDFFISEAETTGLIVPITLQIMEIAFKETKSILRDNPQFHLAFNISALHFKDLDFFKQFDVLAAQYNIVPQQIIFEVTERDLLDKNDDVFKNKMLELRSAGYSLAIDDFGTGHASISYLQHFPFNYLKIDKLFIQAIGTKAITESLNDAIIGMAHELNLMVIAEGVETKEQFAYLAENEVRFLQGWYFSKAIPIEQLMQLLTGEQQ